MPKKETTSVTLPSTGHVITDSLQIVRDAFTHPNETTIYTPKVTVSEPKAKTSQEARPKRVEEPKATPAEKPKAAEPALYASDPTYKLVLITVIAITAVCGIADIILASMWPDPTQLQQQAFAAVDVGWKGGLGAILGLLGGKQA